MNDITTLFIGLIIGVIATYWLYTFLKKRQSRQLTQKQSVVLLEKIRRVCKLVTVEGDFAEIYHYENTKEHLLSLISSKKKALIVINAKVHIGFDLRKVKMRADNQKKRIVLTDFPQPEVLSIEPDLKYYDVKNGLFNRFASTDLTELNKEAKQHILDKIPESGLMDTARKEVLEAVLLIETIVQTIGWKLDYSALEIKDGEKKLIEDKTEDS
ncbi:DUF4230 domain-containing protein [Sinomicrobium weinanense]|uniref:DUF4230 domain-containing protein n=1 Tax=Sinomicrobium weinanense TaxID=2842200 RepID=A0A926Q0I2_9FLAO|nr:DUF4230 domain-containing protein [Sinomicrobium weinanense]MBC9794947.1 DUF4230 domain-containing protein [Sinomicrobium weinanense]MBU3125192.1 DUF4230 domain-containing protein [Sinomicrobium weinanense]